MFCNQCGTKLPEGSAFCPECGAKQIYLQSEKAETNNVSEKATNNEEKHVTNNATSNVTGNVSNNGNSSSDFLNSMIEKLKNNKKIVGIVLAALVVLIVVIVAIGTRKPTVNLNDYVTVNVEGCDPNGSASIEFDKERFGTDYGEILEENAGSSGYTSSYASEEERIEAALEALDNKPAYKRFVSDCVDGDFDKDSNLKNGDKITFKWDCDDEFALKRYGVKIKYSDIEYKVEGLDKYVTSEDDLSDDTLKKLQDEARKDYEDMESGKFSAGGKINSFKYIGMGAATKKSYSYSGNSMLCLVFKIEIQNTYTNGAQTYDEPTTLYWYECFRDVTVNSKGENTYDLDDVGSPYNVVTIDSGINQGLFSNKKWMYTGFSSANELVDYFKSQYQSNYDIIFDTKTLDISKGEDVKGSTDNQVELNAENGIIFANSSNAIIAAEEIKALNDEQLRYAINEIYARHGYIFNDEALLNHYKQFDWYKPEIASDAFSISLFNETEKANVEAMQAERDSRQ